jgi:hypothetical protein
MPFGTLSVSDLLATTQQSVAEVGEQDVFQALNAALVAHNALMEEKVSQLVETSQDRQRRYGGSAAMTMEDLDEFGRADAQKVSAGDTVGFPLRRKGVALQWTRTWLEEHTPAELAAQFTAAQDADAKAIDLEIRRAIFTPTNSTFVDRLVDDVSLAVKALVNADSASIPLDPNGNSFDSSTHTHYLGTASLTAANITSLIETVVEHFGTGQPMLYINRAQETAVRGFTSNFTAYLDARIVPGSAVTTAGGNLNQTQLYNRAIGIFDNAEVWVKPWIPSGYMFAWMMGVDKPLVMRYRRQNALVLEYEDEVHPLRAQGMGRKFGIGVWNRTNGAVLRTANATYAAPTLT